MAHLRRNSIDLVPLNDFLWADGSWDDFDGDFLHELLEEGEAVDALKASCAPTAISSDAAGSKSRVSSDGSRHADTGTDSANKRARADDSAEEKLEKLRHRNRIAQARRRQRQREEIEILESRIANSKDRIQYAQNRSRVLREQKVSMSQRLAKADQMLFATAQEAANHLPPEYCRMQKSVPDSAIVLSRSPKQCPAACSKSRPIESFKGFCPLYIESCLQSMNSSWTANLSFSNILNAHKNAWLMTQTSIPASDICWVLQTLYTVPTGAALSITSSLVSVQCTITLLFCYLLTQLECAFIDKELDCFNGHVTEEAGSSNRFPFVLPTTTVTDSDACTLIEDPIINITQWSSGVNLSCGTNETVAIASAVPFIIKNMLRRYRPFMPASAWQRCCQGFLRKLDIMVGRKRSDGRPGRGKGGLDSGGGDVRLGANAIFMKEVNLSRGVSGASGNSSSDEPVGFVPPDQGSVESFGGNVPPVDANSDLSDRDATIRVPVHEDLGELQMAAKAMEHKKAAAFVAQAGGHSMPKPDECPTTPKFEGTYLRVALLVQLLAESIHSCMQEEPPLVRQPSESRKQELVEQSMLVNSAWEYVWCAALLDSPFTSRDVSVDICGPGLSSLEWMEETHSQLFRRLRFSPDQCSRMVTLWREWQRHRRDLDAQLDDARGKISALPEIEEISDAFLAFMSSKCIGHAVERSVADFALSMQPRSLLGLCPITTQAAKAALDMLQEFQDRDVRMQVDSRATFIRPWFMTTMQRSKSIASIVSHNVKLDGLMLWQIASMQSRRYDLFVSRVLDRNVIMV